VALVAKQDRYAAIVPGSETEAQMQYFAEEVAPLVARACGGQVENPICRAELLPAQ
jgi:hypothetical protein